LKVVVSIISSAWCRRPSRMGQSRWVCWISWDSC